MPDIRSSKDVLNLIPVETLKYEVSVNGSYGFKNKLSWIYTDSSFNIIGFKVYKAIPSKNLLNKKYVITQKVLESTTSSPNMTALSNILYDKSAFLQTDKVKFEKSNSDKFDKIDTEYLFQSISFVNINTDRNKNEYSFTDKNIKFGETYSYYVSAVSNTLKETTPVPINVNIEFLNHPEPPDYLSASETSQGILLIFGNRVKKDISQYLIFRKELNEKNFTLIDVLDSNSCFLYYTDIAIDVKETYVYKVYSRDMWGQTSLQAKTAVQKFSYVPKFTSVKNKPTILFYPLDSGMRIVIKKKVEEVQSVRIERRDDWKFDRNFEVKSFDGFPNSNNYFFENGAIDFLDKGFQKNRAYSYRITSFNKSGQALNYFVTPSISKDDVFANAETNEVEARKSKISKFEYEVVNKSQKNIFVKFSWRIDGEWSYLIIDNGEKKYKIENLHSKVFLGEFLPGKEYKISVRLFNEKEEEMDFKTNMALKL